MIYVTGDTHAEFKHRFNPRNFPEQKEMTKEDYVIICGDFGGIWDVGWESKNEKHWLDWFEERSYTLLFVDGNHENFDRHLRAHDYRVDYIITHCCSTTTQIELGGKGLYEADRVTDYLEFIKNYVDYDKWFFGHYHDNINVNEKEILIYEQMLRIA